MAWFSVEFVIQVSEKQRQKHLKAVCALLADSFLPLRPTSTSPHDGSGVSKVKRNVVGAG
jgi:hypothetical protein